MSGQASGQGASMPCGARRQDQGPREGTILRNEPTILWREMCVDEIMGQVVANFWKGRFLLGSSPLKLASVGVFLALVIPLHHDFHVRFGFGRLLAYQS
jgi:hypothetical protein